MAKRLSAHTNSSIHHSTAARQGRGEGDRRDWGPRRIARLNRVGKEIEGQCIARTMWSWRERGTGADETVWNRFVDGQHNGGF